MEFVIDITERKLYEQALELAVLRAEDASRAKSDFLANMSHEIRTPMNAVVGLSNLLMMSQALPEREKQYVEVLQTSADQLMVLINDMLDMSKIESSALELEKVIFRPAKLIRDCVDVALVTAEKKKLTIEIRMDYPEENEFAGDLLRIQQIVMNLLSNAVKFTEQGGITVESTVRSDSAHPDKVEFECIVRDTGIGMTDEICRKIFGKFMQADSSTTRKYGGTGLGLTISKRLAELMGGDIIVKSAPNQGTEFRLFVPLEVTVF